MARVTHPATSATASNAKTTHTTADRAPPAAISAQRHADLHARVPSYEGCQGGYAGQRDDSARWSHNALEAHPGQPGRRCHERQEGR